MSLKIYFRHRGRIHGPMEKNQVMKLIDLGQVDETDSWSRDGLEWLPLDSLYEMDDQAPARRPAWGKPPANPAPSSPPYYQPAGYQTPDYQQNYRTDHSPSSANWETPLYTQSRLKSWLMPIGMGGVFLAVMAIVMSALRPGREADEDPRELNPGGGAAIPGALNNKGNGRDRAGQEGDPLLDAKQILAKMGNAVALIVRSGEMEPIVGSGFLIRSNLLLTTSAVAGEDRGILISVHFPNANGDEKGPHQARIHHTDPVSGIAILKLDAPQPPLLFSEATLLKSGEDLFVLASSGLEAPKKPGEIQTTSATYTTTTTRKTLEYHRISGKTKPSFSGAPVIDRRGKVVGMIADPVAGADPLCLGSRQILKLVKDVPLP